MRRPIDAAAGATWCSSWGDEEPPSGVPGGRQRQKWQVSVGGGEQPRWRPDGTELFYMTPNGMLMAVGVDTEGDSFRMTNTEALFQTSYEPGKRYDVAADGQSFILNEVAVSVDTPISLVLNWRAASDK